MPAIPTTGLPSLHPPLAMELRATTCGASTAAPARTGCQAAFAASLPTIVGARWYGGGSSGVPAVAATATTVVPTAVARATSRPLTRWQCRRVPSRRVGGGVGGSGGGGSGGRGGRFGSGVLSPLGGRSAVATPHRGVTLPARPTARLEGGAGGVTAAAAADGPRRAVPSPARRVVAVAAEGGRGAAGVAASVLEVDVDGLLLGTAPAVGAGAGLTAPTAGGGVDVAPPWRTSPPPPPCADADRRPPLAGGPLVRAVASVLLPTGYPASVTPDYLRFAVWNTCRQAIRATLDVLGTSSMLAALGVGTPAAAGGAHALSAAANWVLKDGLGSVAKIALASRLAPRVDGSAKRWRVLGDMVMSGATFFELATAVYPAAFLPLASMAVVLKKGADVATGPSYRVVLTSVAAESNVGDVSARAETQLVSGNLVGLAGGLGLVALLNGLAGGAHDKVLAAVYLALVAARVGCTYQSMAGVQLRTLNWDRLMWLLEGAAASVAAGAVGGGEVGWECSGGCTARGDAAAAATLASRLVVPTPADVAEREAFLTGALPPAAARLTVGTHPLGASVAAAFFPPGEAHGIAVGAAAATAALGAAPAGAPPVHVWLRDGARPLDVVRGLWMARLVVAAMPPGEAGMPPLAAAVPVAAAAGNGAVASTGSAAAGHIPAANSSAAAALSTAAATAAATWPTLVAGLEAGGWDLGRLLFSTGSVRYVE